MTCSFHAARRVTFSVSNTSAEDTTVIVGKLEDVGVLIGR